MTVIDEIQNEDPSYDPLTYALIEANISRKTWEAATDRVYFDGYYGPISASDWEEQDGREPYTVSEALKIISTVLDEVEDYKTDYDVHDWDYMVDASDIKAALVSPWFKEIYGYGYPS